MGPFLYSLERRKWLGAPGEGLSVLNHILWYPKWGAGVGSCMFDHSYQRTHSLTQCSPRSGTCLSVHHMHTHTHTLVLQERCRGYTHAHSLTQCSLSSGNSERGARGRLISYSHTHSPFPGEPSQVRDLSVCSSHAHAHTYSGTPREVPGIYTRTLTHSM